MSQALSQYWQLPFNSHQIASLPTPTGMPCNCGWLRARHALALQVGRMMVSHKANNVGSNCKDMSLMPAVPILQPSRLATMIGYHMDLATWTFPHGSLSRGVWLITWSTAVTWVWCADHAYIKSTLPGSAQPLPTVTRVLRQLVTAQQHLQQRHSSP
jgi:hypothetical protein